MSSNSSTKWNGSVCLVLILVAGFVVRILILGNMQDTGLEIIDEQHYHEIARNLHTGNGFGFGSGDAYAPTSARPPLYPWFVSLVWRVVGDESLQAVRLVQVFLSLLNVGLIYWLGTRTYDRRIGLIAAALFCFYPTYIAFSFLLLTEVLYTLLLTLVACGFVLLMRDSGRLSAVATGLSLGLSALVRSVSWPFIFLLLPLTFFGLRSARSTRLQLVALVLAGYALAVVPWAVRNTQLEGVVTVVDTMGGKNLYMGNYEHTPLDRAWDAISLSGEKAWWHDMKRDHPESTHWTDGQKESWAKKNAVKFMLSHPGLTIRRMAIKFAHMWGLERVIIAGWIHGDYQVPKWFAFGGAVLITLMYVVLMLAGVVGVFLAAPEDRRIHCFFLLLAVLICGVHTIVFGHSRYYLPLIPFVCLYAAAALRQNPWAKLRSSWSKAVLPVSTWLFLIAVWTREVLVLETDKIQTFLETLK